MCQLMDFVGRFFGNIRILISSRLSTAYIYLLKRIVRRHYEDLEERIVLVSLKPEAIL